MSNRNKITKLAKKTVLNGNKQTDRVIQLLEWAEKNESNLTTDVFKNLVG